MQILVPEPCHLERLRQAIGLVAAEKIYLGRVTAPEPEKLSRFMNRQLAEKLPISVALDGDAVVGWADVAPHENPLYRHRGELGMGVIASHRGRKLGPELLAHCLGQCPRAGIEKVELNVYVDNERAIRMYERAGFSRVGVIKSFRKLDGRYADCLVMEKFLKE
jgi:ribosomal protein S18 acetylase RimI-like enzyme